MEVIIRFLKESINSEAKPFAVVKDNVRPGDKSFNTEGLILTANQSTCIFFDFIIVGPVNEGVEVQDNEHVDIFFDCDKKENCNYPFCGKQCSGSTAKFRIGGKEPRSY
jgi:hypothetical protein